jgi:hypothetical protein
MTLVVEAPPGYEPERRYIFDVVLSDWLGHDWRLVPARGPDVRITVEGEPADRRVIVPDRLFRADPGAWLTAASLPSTPLPRAPVGVAGSTALAEDEHLPILYGAPPPRPAALVADGPDGAQLQVDVFGSAFFMLTRYEEVVVGERDAYGRFPAAASTAAREDLLGWPVVDAYVELLWTALERVWPRLRRKPRAYRVALTHDVDDPLAGLGRGPALIARQFAGDLLLRRDPKLAVRRARSLVAARRGDHRLDPHNTFDFLMDVSERNGLRSAFYFLANSHVNGSAGAYYVLDHPWIRWLIRHVNSRGHEVGFHAGFDTYLDPARTKDEFARLRTVAESEGVSPQRWGGRQHFLRWANPVTWRNWSEAGLSYDATLAYAEAAGFRTGTCHDYRVFDLERRRPLDLLERPFQIMDVTLFARMALSPQAAFAKVMDIAGQCRRYRGSIGILWHNSEMLRTSREKRWYESLVRAVS